MMEGWFVLTNKGDARVCATRSGQHARAMDGYATPAYVPEFTSDNQAAQYVAERVRQGSDFHLRAHIAIMRCILGE